ALAGAERGLRADAHARHPERCRGGAGRTCPAMSDIAVFGLRGLPELQAGDELGGLLLAACERSAGGLRDGDVVCVAQKAVSKVEGRTVVLSSVTPSERAREIAGDEADPRVVELILRESARIVRRRGAFLICETHHGFVCAAAGVDRSNTGAGDVAVLLPVDPDASARRLRDVLAARAGGAGIVPASFGRPVPRGHNGR